MRFLIVDDDPSQREHLRALLACHGETAVVAEVDAAATVLDRASAANQPFTACFVDPEPRRQANGTGHSEPCAGGLGCVPSWLSRLARRPDGPLVVLMSSRQDRSLLTACDGLYDAFLGKPVDATSVAERLAALGLVEGNEPETAEAWWSSGPSPTNGCTGGPMAAAAPAGQASVADLPDDLCRELLGRFLVRAVEQCDAIETGCCGASEEWLETIAETAHQLAGSGGQFGQEQVSRLARELEANARLTADTIEHLRSRLCAQAKTLREVCQEAAEREFLG